MADPFETFAKTKGWRYSPAHDAIVHDDFSERLSEWEDACALYDIDAPEQALAALKAAVKS